MKKNLLLGIFTLLISLCIVNVFAAKIPQKAQPMMCSKSAIELKMSMRQLWEEHIVYTRNFIISSLANLEDADKIAARLLKNQDDIGNAVMPFYGDDAGKKLSALLREHILIAADVVKAAKTGNDDGLNKNMKNWYANADEIATFLSSANPNWQKQKLMDMLHKHLELTTGEVTSRLKKDWSSDINSYDQGHLHMLKFADILSEGIIKQFPEKFKS